MQKYKDKIKIGNNDYFFTAIKSRRVKLLRITVTHLGEIILTIPQNVNFPRAKDFLLSKEKWLLTSLKRIKKNQSFLLSDKGTKKEYLQKKDEALNLVIKKINYFNRFYRFRIGKVSIRNQKTRWGSCSKTGNLNFNYRVVYLPESHLDYLIVHELCHLAQFNHSKKFWRLVALTISQYRKIKRNMKYL